MSQQMKDRLIDGTNNLNPVKLEKVNEWVFDGIEDGSHYHGMSYEEGMRDMLEILTGDMDIDNFLSE